MKHEDVDAAVAEMLSTLTPHVNADWSGPAGSLTWSCWRTAAHMAHDLMAYTVQLTSRRDEAYLPLDLMVRPAATPAQVLRIATTCGRLLSDAVAAAGPDVQAWHWGLSDAGGFAALGVGEVLVHTYDVTRGLGVPWQPSASLSAGVVSRLIPDAPPGDPVDVLLWCTGRAELNGRAPRTSWTWKAARPH